MQLTFANPIKTVYGEGSIGKRNAMQLLFVTYAMQETIPKDERTYKWKIATGASDDEVLLTM